MKEIKICFIFCVFCILSCNQQKQKDLINHVSNERPIDSLKREVMQLRKIIYQESKSSKEDIKNNFELLDYYLFAFVELKNIPKDSLKFHAPIKSVNEMVLEYNKFGENNIGKDFIKLNIFKDEREYDVKRNQYLSVLLKNEIILHKNHGYILKDR